MVVIIIAVYLFLGAFGGLFAAAMGMPTAILGIPASGVAAHLAPLVQGLLGGAAGVGLLLLSRWGWWLGVIHGALSILNSVLMIPHVDSLVANMMANQPMPPMPGMPDMMMAMMHASMAMGIAFGALLEMAIVGYLVYRRGVFGVGTG